MTALALPARMDSLLRRLPGASWRALPSLVVAGIVAGSAWGIASWLLGAAPWVLPVVALVVAGPATWALSALNSEIFASERPARQRRLTVVAVFSALPCLLASWSGFSAAVADAARSPLLQVVAVAAAVAAVLAGLIGVVGIAIGTVRDDVGVPTLLRAAIFATVRHPLGPMTALLSCGAVAWLALTWSTGILFLAAPVMLVLMVPSGWMAALSTGISLPPLAPLRPLRPGAVKGIE